MGSKVFNVNVPYSYLNRSNNTLKTTRIIGNLESYQTTISSVIEKVFKTSLRKRFIPHDLRPLLESTNSLASFTSSKDDERFSDCFIWSEEDTKRTKRTCKRKTCHNFNSNKVAPDNHTRKYIAPDNQTPKYVAPDNQTPKYIAPDKNYYNVFQQNLYTNTIQSPKKKTNSRSVIDEKKKIQGNIYYVNNCKNVNNVRIVPKNAIPISQLPQGVTYTAIPYPNYYQQPPIKNQIPIKNKSSIKIDKTNQSKCEKNIKLGYFLNLIDRTTAPNRRKKTASMCPFIPFKRSREKYLEDETISKEHREQLKKKLIDVQKRPDTYVILALF